MRRIFSKENVNHCSYKICLCFWFVFGTNLCIVWSRWSCGTGPSSTTRWMTKSVPLCRPPSGLTKKLEPMYVCPSHTQSRLVGDSLTGEENHELERESERNVRRIKWREIIGNWSNVCHCSALLTIVYSGRACAKECSREAHTILLGENTAVITYSNLGRKLTQISC